MIYKQCVLTIANNTATLDEDVYLYRLDKNVELYFTIVNNKYKFDKSDLNNIINMTNASYFQMRLYKNEEVKYTFAIQPTDEGKAKLTITNDLIDEPIEVGDYDFQISLLDADKSSMVSMPIAKQQIHVCEPLVDNQAIMGKAVLGLSSLASGEIKNAFDSEGNYIREIHNDGDILSAQLVNKFEEALDTNSKNIKTQNNNLPHTISSKKLATVPAKDIKLEETITVNNVSINKDRRYYIEFLGNKKPCSTMVDKEMGNSIICTIGGYIIQASKAEQSTGLSLLIINTNAEDSPISTNLVIYEEEVNYLDSKYLETDLVLQNSISLGRTGDIGMGSVAIGGGVEASGSGSHAEGIMTIASASQSHAEGASTTASGEQSHAEGSNTKALGNQQHVQGRYNIEDTANKYAHIVGNGTKGHNSNAHTLDWNGNAWFAGKLSQEGTPTEDKDLVTKKYVDDNTPIKSLPVNPTTRTGAVVVINNITSSGCYALPKRTDGKYWTNLMMKVMPSDGSGEGKSIMLNGYQNYVFYVNLDTKKIYCDNLRIVYKIGATDDTTGTTDIYTEPYFLPTTNTKEYTPTKEYHPTTKKYVDDSLNNMLSFNESGELVVTINGVSKTFVPKEN